MITLDDGLQPTDAGRVGLRHRRGRPRRVDTGADRRRDRGDRRRTGRPDRRGRALPVAPARRRQLAHERPRPGSPRAKAITVPAAPSTTTTSISRPNRSLSTVAPKGVPMTSTGTRRLRQRRAHHAVHRRRRHQHGRVHRGVRRSEDAEPTRPTATAYTLRSRPRRAGAGHQLRAVQAPFGDFERRQPGPRAFGLRVLQQRRLALLGGPRDRHRPTPTIVTAVLAKFEAIDEIAIVAAPGALDAAVRDRGHRRTAQREPAGPLRHPRRASRRDHCHRRTTSGRLWTTSTTATTPRSTSPASRSHDPVTGR